MDLTKFACYYPEQIAAALVQEWSRGMTVDDNGNYVSYQPEHQALWDALVAGLKGDVESAVDYVTATEHHSADHVLKLVGVRPTHVTVYELGRQYGGPEEGGWWYDTGDVAFEQEISPDEDLDALKAKLEAEYPYGNNRSSMAPRGRDYDIHYGFSKGKNWPIERPHYE